jgi:hypothetical protein
MPRIRVKGRITLFVRGDGQVTCFGEAREDSAMVLMAEEALLTLLGPAFSLQDIKTLAKIDAENHRVLLSLDGDWRALVRKAADHLRDHDYFVDAPSS